MVRPGRLTVSQRNATEYLVEQLLAVNTLFLTDDRRGSRADESSLVSSALYSLPNIPSRLHESGERG